MASAWVMSRDEVGPAQVAEVAELCGLSEDLIEDIYSCTYTQIAFTEQGRTSSLSFIYEFGPDVDIDRYLDALREAVARNPIFRTRIVKSSSLGYVQAVTKVEHETEKLSGDPFEYVQRPEIYDVELGQQLFITKCIGRYMVVVINHNVMDNFSWNTFLDVEIKGVYQGLPQQTRAPYKGFVQQCHDLDASAATSFWKPRFQGVPAIFPKPLPNHKTLNKVRPARKISLDHIGTKVPVFQVPSFIEVAWVITASMFADSEKIAYGLILAGRSPDLDSHTGWLGPMMTGVPVQANIQRTMTIEQLLKDRVLSLRQLQREPTLQFGMDRIATISEATKVGTEFQAILNFRAPVQKSTERTEDVSLIKLRNSINLSSFFPLEIISAPMDDGISMEVNHDLDVVSDEVTDQILNQFEHTIRAIMDASPQTRIDQLKLLNPHDHAQILSWNEKTPAKSEGCIHSLFKAKAQEQPDSLAIDGPDGSITYQKLDQLSDRLAHLLRDKGVQLEDRVGHVFSNSSWAIVAILGIAKAGAVCVPIDTSEKADRVASFISQTGIQKILVPSIENASLFGPEANLLPINSESTADWPDVPEHPSELVASPESLCLIISSDASNGPQKRVLIEHGSLVSALTPFAERLNWHTSSRILHASPYTSKAGITESLGALLVGSCLCIAPEEIQGANLTTILNNHQVNSILLPSTEWQDLSIDAAPSIETVILTGGPVKLDSAANWPRNIRIFNTWGACETAGFSAIAEIDRNKSDSSTENVGRATGSSIWLASLRDINQLSPIGGVGELIIEGPVVARSYLDDAKQTAASFIAPPEWAPSKDRSSRFLRTGQLARYNQDGSISLVGKSANRVKVGKEIVQLEEIENLLSSYSEIREVAVASKIMKGRTHLFALVSLRDSRVPSEKTFQALNDTHLEICKEQLGAVQARLASALPSHKVPTMWTALESLPQTPSRKINRTAVAEWLKAGNGDKYAIAI